MFQDLRINPMEAFESDPPHLDFVLPGFLSGTVGTLFSPGGVGKSYFAMQAGISIAAAGCDGADMLGFAPRGGRVVYFAAEDPAVVLRRRLHAIGGHLPPETRQEVGERFDLIPVMGQFLNMAKDEDIEAVRQYASNARLIVLDTLSRVHQLDENSNGQMSALMQCLESIAASTGAAILYLHHVSKGSASTGQADQQHAARGASALVDNARWGASVSKMTTDEAAAWSDSTSLAPIGEYRSHYLRFSVSKQNYSEPVPDRWFRREAGGVLAPVELIPRPGNGTKKNGVKRNEL